MHLRTKGNPSWCLWVRRGNGWPWWVRPILDTAAGRDYLDTAEGITVAIGICVIDLYRYTETI